MPAAKYQNKKANLDYLLSEVYSLFTIHCSLFTIMLLLCRCELRERYKKSCSRFLQNLDTSYTQHFALLLFVLVVGCDASGSFASGFHP